MYQIYFMNWELCLTYVRELLQRETEHWGQTIYFLFLSLHYVQLVHDTVSD